MPPSSSLDADVRKTINRWTREGYYVYLRPITSKYIDARAKHKTYWKVSVELRTVPPGHWEAEGYNLDECIRELSAEVPRNREEWHEDQPAGWLAPGKVLEKEIAAAKERVKKLKNDKAAESERPRKRPKKKK